MSRAALWLADSLAVAGAATCVYAIWYAYTTGLWINLPG